MKIKEFRKKYQEETWRKATPQEKAMYEFCMSMKIMKKTLELIIAKREQGEVTVENAHKLVDDSICALLDANELLGCMIKKQEKQSGKE
jgi:hypothetical protein